MITTRRSPIQSLFLALGLSLAAAPARADDSPSLDAAARAKSTVCSDGKSHYVVLAPHEHASTQLFYGDGKRFYSVPRDPRGMMSGDWFPDPRYFNKTNNSSFRGLDLRLYSHVDHNAEKKTCAVQCGDKAVPLQIVENDKAQALLAASTYEATPRKWEPYALARDTEGKYYYVDRGYAAGDAKNFRLFVGPKGALKQQKMTNVVSDSEGDMFATKTGSLRMILGKPESSWVAGKKTTRLLLVPVGENLPMIWNDLGVYTGERLGTPCDDL